MWLYYLTRYVGRVASSVAPELTVTLLVKAAPVLQTLYARRQAVKYLKHQAEHLLLGACVFLAGILFNRLHREHHGQD